jgi:plastocyanin
MKDSTFQPQNIKVSEGATVIWINEDGFPHTSTSYNSSAWSSGFVGPGKEFLLTVNLPPRTYYYHCNIHLQMVGELSVVD